LPARKDPARFAGIGPVRILQDVLIRPTAHEQSINRVIKFIVPVIFAARFDWREPRNAAVRRRNVSIETGSNVIDHINHGTLPSGYATMPHLLNAIIVAKPLRRGNGLSGRKLFPLEAI
jgi:hypothetical protein